MDEELLRLIEEVAELPATAETPGVARDELYDTWVLIARELRRRGKEVKRET